MWFIHIVLSYFVALTGLGCLVTRLFPKYAWMHIWFGRGYVFSMLWCTASSLLIHNSGLPLGVLISFLYVLGGMSIGCLFIWFHQINMNKLALENIWTQFQNGSLDVSVAPDAKLALEKGVVAQRKTWKERMFSYKALHGAAMLTSYCNIVGRIFRSNQSGDFTCHTYPVYKPVPNNEFQFPAGSTNTSIYFLEARNPNYDRQPWANREGTWAAMLLFTPFLGSLAIGAVIAYYGSKKSIPKEKESTDPLKVYIVEDNQA